MKRYATTIITLIFLLIGSYSVKAQSFDDEPLYDKLKKNFQKEYFSVGSLVQFVGDFQPERNMGGNNGFSIANLRLNVSGDLDNGFGYLVQTKFDTSPTILDAKAYWKYSEGFQIDAGLFKSPFSYELLTGAAAIDFVNRSRVVSSLAPSRQIGVQVSGWLLPNTIHYAAGAFNGNGFGGNSNDNNNFLYSGRLEYHMQSSPNNNLVLGVNGAISEDDNISLSGITNNFDGTRSLGGADARWTINKFMVSSEFIYSSLETTNSDFNPFGFHATAGYMAGSKTQILLRWDQFDADGTGPDTESVIAGLNIWPTQVSEIQFNYILPTNESIEFSQILINFQIGF
ncbi:Phosphate-selective porin O and P [Fodinibius salinus]|uniref:Phosphate-selective porin O and P n=1 Tax=Fodinibius salinus TaxID=860790 RepID=A0A5D3YNT6_9BACT|nr:porin [Fodinibius salinus]TYP95352.1 Phosphate-selective porin O and P [Fodinibius salinus]